MRTRVAVLALRLFSNEEKSNGEKTYKKPRERIRTTENFVRGFILIFQTNAIGRIPNAQSVTALIAACV
jgi:hypothetical protein